MKKYGIQVLLILLCLTCGVGSAIFLKRGYQAAQEERKQQMEEVLAEIDVGTLQQENQTEEYGQPPKRAQTAEELPGVQEQAGNETAPKTGDLFRIIGWIVLAVLSGGGACMIGKGQRKKPRI